jgi:hypothetical protein
LASGTREQLFAATVVRALVDPGLALPDRFENKFEHYDSLFWDDPCNFLVLRPAGNRMKDGHFV